MKTLRRDEPKYRQILQQFKDEIRSGKYKPGQRLPSEHEVVKTFGTSRVTVNRALRELQLAGFIDRRAGSGSYVRATQSREYTFGLLIPDLGRTEIFEPLCHGLAEAREAEHHALLWGKSLSESAVSQGEVEARCRQYISKKVSGVFFAPLEHTSEKDTINRSIADAFDNAGISVVLLDRDLVPYPDRSKYDLIGIDNRRAGYVITQHLVSTGAKNIVFIARPGSAPTVDARIAGFREAIMNSALEFRADHVVRVDPLDSPAVQRTLKQIRPDGIVCANDLTAAQVMKVLNEMGISIPDEMKIAGFDDVKYASLLPVPLTTIHQPCIAMGAAALESMVHRLQHRAAPSRDVMLNFSLVVRGSTCAEPRAEEHF